MSTQSAAELVALKTRRTHLVFDLRALQARIDDVAARLAGDAYFEQVEHGVPVPRTALVKANAHSRKAWRKRRVRDVYVEYRECETRDACWYAQNLGRLDELKALYEVGPEWDDAEATLCDRCVADPALRKRAVDANAPLYPEKQTTRMIPEQHYEPDIAEYLRRCAAGDVTADSMDLKEY
jgi:hypothetical protein